ncbi:MAG: class I SAM-dependent methyltransferase [Alphaproteobacteria bacterium]|nr:class I SAM-dependent methyltransferase [Alphaproteobacteria bacterium]
MSIDVDLEAPVTAEQPTLLPDWLLRPLLRARTLDAILRRRARDIVAKAAMDRHLPADGLCLDVGAGFGHVAEEVLARAPQRRCVAIDPVWRPTDRLARRLDRVAAGRWQFLTADGMRLPFADGSFEAVWMAFVLHHVPYDSQWRLLAEIGRVLKPHGVFMLLEDTPATADEWAVVERADRRLNVETHDQAHCYRSPAEWRPVLAHCGFVVQEEIAFSRVFPRASLAPVPHRAFVCRKLPTA